MFAVVANGFQTICSTQRQLDNILALYTYPKFAKFNDEEAALRWIREHSRAVRHNYHTQYGDTASYGFANITYVIENNSVKYHVDTEQLGYVSTFTYDNDVAIRSGRNSLDIIVSNVVLDDLKITSHVIAIKRVLMLLGGFIDVNIEVPDMSVYLAITKYRGSNYIITGLQRDIEKRLGGVSFSVRGEGYESSLLL